MTATLDTLRWVNTYAALSDDFHQRVAPTPLPDPYLVALNNDVADLLGLDRARIDRDALVRTINGDHTPHGADPIAAIYAGHQFGVWVPQLGDGRAILIGEIETASHEHWELQLKGSGLTRFSRMGDGRAVLRSTVREYLGSEAMQGLGIPTTRALAIVGSDAPVYRERTETAAILVRVSPSHVRFGSFELFASRGRADDVKRLADYVITHDYPEFLTLPTDERYGTWYREIVDRTARLMAQWTAVGFAHGVMNTDNMSILGLTLDYGPFGWLDAYDRGFICNHSDPAGRYAFDQQPLVGLWNCARLAEALVPLVTEEQAVAALESYRGTYESAADALTRAKFGVTAAMDGDAGLFSDFFALLQESAADHTNSFRALSRYELHSRDARDPLHQAIAPHDRLDAWLAQYSARLAREGATDADRHPRMLATNPKFVLRNWLAQDAINNAQTRNYDRIEEIRQVLRTPFNEHPEREAWAAAPPEWARGLEVSCSS